MYNKKIYQKNLIHNQVINLGIYFRCTAINSYFVNINNKINFECTKYIEQIKINF